MGYVWPFDTPAFKIQEFCFLILLSSRNWSSESLDYGHRLSIPSMTKLAERLLLLSPVLITLRDALFLSWIHRLRNALDIFGRRLDWWFGSCSSWLWTSWFRNLVGDLENLFGWFWNLSLFPLSVWACFHSLIEWGVSLFLHTCDLASWITEYLPWLYWALPCQLWPSLSLFVHFSLFES